MQKDLTKRINSLPDNEFKFVLLKLINHQYEAPIIDVSKDIDYINSIIDAFYQVEGLFTYDGWANLTNTDTILIDNIIKISNQFNCKTFIETGTCLGGTSKVVAKHFENVITYEISPIYYYLSKENFTECKNINLLYGNSIDYIGIHSNNSTFLFLDAHWGSEPLLTELDIIANKKIKPPICIHDFVVPDESNTEKNWGSGWEINSTKISKFRYDKWKDINGDNNIPNDFSYVKSHIENIYGRDGYKILYPIESKINVGWAIFYKNE